MVDAAEWKRRQYPPGTKISFKAFGRDRRLPITQQVARDAVETLVSSRGYRETYRASRSHDCYVHMTCPGTGAAGLEER